MTREEIIALAMDAGFNDITPLLDDENSPQWRIDAANRWIDHMLTFATLIAEREREACIKDCMSNISPQMMAEGDWPAAAAEMVMFCVADIRKRSKC